jgi:outer membrane biosynthesis protein TonB
MKLPRKAVIGLTALVFVAGAVTSSVLLQTAPEQKPKEVAVKQTSAVKEAQEEAKPVENAPTQPQQQSVQQSVQEPAPEQSAQPTPEENKTWFVAEAKANIRSLLVSRNLAEKADSHPHFWSWQDKCLVEVQEKNGGFADRAVLEQAATQFQAAYYENVSCKVLRF